MPEIAVLALGNQYFGDDSVGILIARMLRDKLPPSVTLMECSSAFDALMNSPDCDTIIIVDSFLSDEPGSLSIEVRERKGSEEHNFQVDPHDMDVDKLMDMLWSFKKSLRKIVFIGIGVSEIELGESVTPAVSRGMEAAVDLITQWIRDLTGEEAYP